MTSSVDLISSLRDHSTSVNLVNLQKKDGEVQRVLFTAKHVALYHLNTATKAIERQEVEGPFFIVERRSVPYYQLIILNRKSTDDWRHAVTSGMGTALEIQEKYLHFQSNQPGLVITLWFHEEPDCVNAITMLKKVCAHLLKQSQTGQMVQFELPSFTQSTAATQPKPITAPVSHNNNSANQYKPQKASTSPPVTSTVPLPAVPPIPKTFISPYAPPPPVKYNVALPPTNQKNDRELQQRLNGFLSHLIETDEQHTRAYEEELKEIEAKKKDNARRYAEEERRKKEHEARLEREERKSKQQLSSSPPSASNVPTPSFPTMLSPDQLTMLQSFSSSASTAAPSNLAPPPTIPSTQPVVPTSDGLTAEARNLANVKARKAARAAAAQPPPPPPSTFAALMDPAAYSQQAQPSQQQPPTSTSSLPASLLFAASQSASHPPMPSLPTASSSPGLRPQTHPAQLLTPITVASTQPPPQPSPEIHPLLAMLNQSVSSQPSTTQPVLPASSPYAITSTASPVLSTPSTSTPTLLAPSHFLTTPAPTTSIAPPIQPTITSTPFLTPASLLAALQGPSTNTTPSSSPSTGPYTNGTTSSPPLMSKVDYQQYLIRLVNDPATSDWLYQKYLTQPDRYPFA